MDINVLISDISVLDDVLSFPGITGIYVEMERVTRDRIKPIVHGAHAAGKNIYFAMPYIFDSSMPETLMRKLDALMSFSPDGYLIRNLDELGFIEEKGIPGKRILDAGLYTWNKAAIKQLEKLGADYFTAPYELNKYELSERGFEKTEIVAYGYYPVIISNNCLKQTTGKCAKETEPYTITKLHDRTGADFRAVNCCTYCYNIIYNSVPTWLLDEPAIYKADSIRLSFTTEPSMEIKSILKKFFDGELVPGKSITRGHFNRGAE